MESLHTENLISTQLQVNESMQDDHWIPEEKENNNLIIQMNDVAPGLAAFEATTQLSTAEIAPELSNGMDAKLPKSHEKRKESEINITGSTALQRQPEVPYQLGEDMELSVPDHLRILQSPSQMHEQVNQRISDHEGEPCPVSQNMAVNKVTMTPVSGGGGSLDLLRMQYREDSSGDHFDSDSDDSSSTSSSSSSSSSGVNSFLMNELDQDENQEGGLSLGKGLLPMRTQDELLIEDLPAVENLNISLSEETEMESIGVISSIIDKLVIVESKKDTLPLNEGTVFFSKERIAIGKVFEVFGPVCQPYYILRFNSQEDIDQKNLKQGESVFFAPQVKDFTEYIFTEQLNEIKGSDASWKNDQEPPPEALDFSDDEQERLAKQKLKKQKRHQRQQLCEEKCDSESETPTCTPQMTPRRKAQNQNFERKRHVHHNPQNFGHSNFHGNPHFQPQDTPQFYSQCGPYFQPQGSLNFQQQSNPLFQRQGNAPFQHQGSPHFQPNYILPTPESFHLPFHATNFPQYPPPGPNPPHIGMGPIAPGPYLGMMFHLPPPPPPPPPGN